MKYNIFDFENFDIPALVKQCDSFEEAVRWKYTQKHPDDYEITEDKRAITQNTDNSVWCGLCNEYVVYPCEDTDHCLTYKHPDYDVFG